MPWKIRAMATVNKYTEDLLPESKSSTADQRELQQQVTGICSSAGIYQILPKAQLRKGVL